MCRFASLIGTSPTTLFASGDMSASECKREVPSVKLLRVPGETSFQARGGIRPIAVAADHGCCQDPSHGQLDASRLHRACNADAGNAGRGSCGACKEGCHDRAEHSRARRHERGSTVRQGIITKRSIQRLGGAWLAFVTSEFSGFLVLELGCYRLRERDSNPRYEFVVTQSHFSDRVR